jgi:SAM-dependent methyltransferase
MRQSRLPPDYSFASMMARADAAVSSTTPHCEPCSRVLDEVQEKIERLLRGIAPGAADPVLLDVGCWDGESSRRWGEATGAKRLLGVEVYEEQARLAEERGMEVARIDLEAERFPWPDGSVDVVVCNQVLEHLKNVWLPMSEIHRVLRPGGHAILSVPNLAALHNRVLLALGRQPTSIRVFGPHVRGYAFHEFCEFVERGGAFAIERRRAAGFYPLLSPWSKPLSVLWRAAGHTTIVLARKTGEQPVWSDYLGEAVEGGMQTFYGDPPAAE